MDGQACFRLLICDVASYIDVILADFVHDYCGTTAGMLQVFSVGDAKWKCFRRNEAVNLYSWKVGGSGLWVQGPWEYKPVARKRIGRARLG
jgi:hypothetical protein